MPTTTFKKMIENLPLGTSSATTVDKYVYATREEYEAGMLAVANDETLSPSECADILANTPEPEETYEEYMERHDD